MTNLIRGYNTNKYILKETVHYSIINCNIAIINTIQALDNIIIERYYGLQTQNSPWRGKIIYKDNGIVVGISNNMDTNHPKTKFYFSGIDSYTLVSLNRMNRITAWIDENYDIGRRLYVADNRPCAFTCSYGKSYFNLINGIQKYLSKDGIISWRGGYVIESN